MDQTTLRSEEANKEAGGKEIESLVNRRFIWLKTGQTANKL
ncbi:hypothetical protein [Bacillus marinisedimentorum]|nr:hypothetical protein [Bacillus marinisedimentorum]